MSSASITCTSDPCDLLLRELWIHEIFLKHVHVESPAELCLDTLALSMVCKWFAREIWQHTTLVKRNTATQGYFSNSVMHYMQTNPTSTLTFLGHLWWPTPIFDTYLYHELARACFARRTTDVFFDIAQRAPYFYVPLLVYARTTEDMERFMDLSRARHKRDKLTATQLFVLLCAMRWSPWMLKWLVCFVEDVLIGGDYSAGTNIPYAVINTYLRAIIVHRSGLEQCAAYMNVIWSNWQGSGTLSDQHFRVKHSVTMALNMNCPGLVYYFISNWPPRKPNKARQIVYSYMERLNILFGNTASDNLSTLTQNAPASQAYLREIGFIIV